MLLRGDAGWGEWSPFLEYDDATARPWLACAREAADVGWPEPLRTVVPVNVTVPATDPDRAHAIVTAGGCRTAKVKVAERGQTLADDLARVEAVRDALGPDGLVRVDANGAWDVDEAVRAIAAIDRAAGGLEYVEQPVMAVEDLAVVRRRVDVPVAADESIRRAEDPYRVRDLEAADVAVLKVQPLGGVRACLRIAEDIGLPVVVSSAVESSVGIAAGVALAAALPELHHACGLATVQLLTDDVVTDPMLPVDGMLRVSPTRGGRRGAGAARGSRRPGGPLARPAGVGRAGSASVTNPSTELARTVVTALRGAGVREVVIAPGSRNAPLSFALYDAATGGGLRLHTRIDERTAGFLALGLAKVGNRPAAVSCTSGTAVANLLPAVVEAAHAGVPMVVVTADRPARLRGSGANQTTDQVGIFGSFAPTLDVAAADLDAILAFVRSHGGNRPVHLNVQLDEPLLPDDGGWEAAAEEPAVVAGHARRSRGATGPRARAPHGRRRRGRRGSARPRPRREGGLAAPRRAVQRVSHRRPAWSAPTGCCCPVSWGSRSSGSWSTATPRCRARSRACSPATTSRSSRPATAAGGPSARSPWPTRWTRSTSRGPDDPAWLEAWREADRATSRGLDRFLAAEPDLTPYEVAGAVSRALPAGGLLFVGASNPVRDLDLMVARYEVGGRRKVIANRGLAGIDGTISAAIGAALGRPRSTRALALMGDVTFLHDTTGLLLGPREERPDLTIVVVNDDGGSIFATLEQGAPEHADRFDTLFGTPHGVDVASLCAAARVPHLRVTGLPELEQALATPNGGIEVVEARVRRDNRAELDAKIRALVLP